MKKLLILLVLLVSGLSFGQENPAKEMPQLAPVYDMSEEDMLEMNRFIASDLNTDSVAQETFKIFNEYRRYVGVSELEFDTTLQKAALIQAEYMADNYLSTHIHSNPKLKTPPMRLKSVDPDGVLKFDSEIATSVDYIFNISRKRNLSQQILDGFYYSKSHISIIEKIEPTKVGIGIVKNGVSYYVVAVFGK